jgi:hypothetical protein
VKYELGLSIPEDDILHSHRRENLKSYIASSGCAMYWRRNVSPVKYELELYIPEDHILHSHRRENLKSYICIGRTTEVSRYRLDFVGGQWHRTSR